MKNENFDAIKGPGNYILFNATTGLYKIGMVIKNSVGRNRRAVQHKAGTYLIIVHAQAANSVDDARELERHLHEHFANRRPPDMGEWFALSPIDLADCLEMMQL